MSMQNDNNPFAKMLGHVISAVEETVPDHPSTRRWAAHVTAALAIHTENGPICLMSHEQDCCESVYLESGLDELKALIGGTIYDFREAASHSRSDEDGDEQWVFYIVVTDKGHATLRWEGSSNGYYSTSVNVRLLDPVPTAPAGEDAPPS